MKQRPRRNRNRLEFGALEAQIDPSFLERAWRQFCDSLLHDQPSSESFAEQFKLLDCLRRRHARRDRYNAKRRQKKLRAAHSQFNPRIAGYLALDRTTSLDLFGMDAVSTGGPHFAPQRGVLGTDMRLTKRFLRECEVIECLLNPPKYPWRVDRVPVVEEEKREIPAREESFLQSLLPTPIPEVSKTLPFEHAAALTSKENEGKVRKVPTPVEEAS